MMVSEVARGVAMLKDKMTFLLAVEATRSAAEIVTIGLETTPPSDPDATLPPLLSVLVIIPTFTVVPYCMGAPIVTPEMVMVKEPAVTAAVVVMTLAVCMESDPNAAIEAAKPVEAASVGLPDTKPDGRNKVTVPPRAMFV
jgi:hypothetical protein